MQEPKKKERELASWEADLKRREKVNFVHLSLKAYFIPFNVTFSTLVHSYSDSVTFGFCVVVLLTFYLFKSRK